MRGLKPFIVIAFVASAWPAAAGPSACADPLKPMLRAELFFGRMIGHRIGVTERQWQRFVDRELTPRFPDGLTIADGKGQWRAGKAILREPSKIVIVVTTDDAKARDHIAAATQAYIELFKQKSVGVVTQTVCAAF